MGLFDKMFGPGAEVAQQQPKAEQRFNELKQKYQTVLTTADQQHVQFHNLHVQDDKLYIKGTAPSEDAKNKFWAEIKLVNPKLDDISADIAVNQGLAQGAAVGGKGAARPTRSKPAIRSLRSASNSMEIRPSLCVSSTPIAIN
jgi:hypothetical protein